MTLHAPIVLPGRNSCERVYVLPPELTLEPQQAYLISVRLRGGKTSAEVFTFAFRTDSRGLPVAYRPVAGNPGWLAVSRFNRRQILFQ